MTTVGIATGAGRGMGLACAERLSAMVDALLLVDLDEATLKAAAASFDDGRVQPGINQLGAFQNKVRAQVAPLDPVLADSLINAAQVIIDALSGP